MHKTQRVNATSRKLQDPKLDLNAAVAMLVSQKTKGLSRPNVKHSPSTNDMEQLYLAHRTTCRLARVHAMFASDAELTPSQKFRVTSYIPVIDQFVVSLAHRLST